MRSIMFDIDGTLVDSFAFDEACFTEAVKEELGGDVNTNWQTYRHVTDRGLLMELLGNLGRADDIAAIEPVVKKSFIQKIKQHLAKAPARATPGAAEFINQLKQRNDVNLSIATGGWLESALLKLASAGIDVDEVPIATSNDHHIRTEIMRLACRRAANVGEVIYFGDAEWDRNACAELGFKFIVVGKRTNHSVRVTDFTNRSELSAHLGINL